MLLGASLLQGSHCGSNRNRDNGGTSGGRRYASAMIMMMMMMMTPLMMSLIQGLLFGMHLLFSQKTQVVCH
jgi:hypothetical protein